MRAGITCFQYVSQTDVVQNYVQLVGLIEMELNKMDKLCFQKADNLCFHAQMCA